MADVKAVWRAMSKYQLAIQYMENYVYSDQTAQDFANMRVAVIQATDAGFTELRKALRNG